jgi:hypothetical protein
VLWEYADGTRAVAVMKDGDKKRILDELCGKGVCRREYLGEFWLLKK